MSADLRSDETLTVEKLRQSLQRIRNECGLLVMNEYRKAECQPMEALDVPKRYSKYLPDDLLAIYCQPHGTGVIVVYPEEDAHHV